MAEGLTKQLQLQRLIARSLENFKKLGRSNLTAARVRSQINSLKETWHLFLDGHACLLYTISEDLRSAFEYFKDEVFESTEEQYQCTLDHMTDCLEELEPLVSPTQPCANSTRVRSEASALSGAHLPSIQLPPFDGNHDEWEQFRDRFKTLIIDNRDLTDFTRMHFLSSCLRGCARDAISHISITADNFEVAWATLISRFESKQRALHKHFSTIHNLTELTRESASDLHGLCDKMTSAVAALNKLGRSPSELWNDILVYNLVKNLDPVTRKAWKLKVGANEAPPSYDDLNQFLRSRTHALDEISEHNKSKLSPKPASMSRVHVSTASTSVPSGCPLCNQSHMLSACSKFTSKNASQRREIIKMQKRCFNCLSAKHGVASCQSKYSCRICHKRHHTLLHIDSPTCSDSMEPEKRGDAMRPSQSQNKAVNSLTATSVTSDRAPVLLATANVKIRVPSGRTVVVRALLDQGSEMTFISENLAQMLRVRRIQTSLSIAAVGGTHAGTVKHAAPIVLSPRRSDEPSFATNALILRELTSYVPKSRAYLRQIGHLSDLQWADDDPTSSDPIEVIIGADLYHAVIRDGLRKGDFGEPFAQNSIFGWIISGPLKSLASHKPSLEHDSRIYVNHATEVIPLEEELKRFWEIEDLPYKPVATPLENQCEEYFQLTHSRASDGRYIVRLPFKTEPPLDIGDSKFRATRMFHATVRRLKENRDLEDAYREFMNEYESLGHMKRASAEPNPSEQSYYIPHHAVLRESSATTRLRVVFNASSPTSNGSSLNDHMLAGPKLQSEITSVILSWRNYKYVYAADIAKMYRQIVVDPRDRNYQRILWSSHSETPPREYQLLTVTYGTKSAPFLALRVLEQLRRDEGSSFPLASVILKDHIYIDDVLFGDDEMSLLRQKRNQLISLLARGGFTLRKWASNSSSLLSDIDEADHGLACNKQLAADERLKILGISWNPSSDVFEFHALNPPPVPTSKRAILATIAKLYDPLGWVTPISITAKIFMQQLWRHNINWDDAVPDALLARWKEIYSRLSDLNSLRIARWSGLEKCTKSAEIHGFSDASNVAYAAAVYLKVVSSTGNVTVTLLAAKAKVAPIKSISIPRLELSAALLLARLLDFIRKLNRLQDLPCHCWTDSTVVLAWVKQHPSRWKMFVANRVTEIQERLPNVEWHHVPTQSNPADCASRGMLGDEIREYALWWNGPPWLKLSKETWPKSFDTAQLSTSLEEKVVVLQSVKRRETWDLALRYSSWPKLIRVTAYILKFIKACRENLRRQSRCRGSKSNSHVRANGINISVSAADCHAAKLFWIKHIQLELFEDELKTLSRKGNLASKSSLLSLKPFIDSDGILRVGGRLENAPYSFAFRHPIVLAAHPLVALIVSQAHLRALHAGSQLTLCILRRDFWILRARTIVKSIIHKCVKCTRERAAIPAQLMGNLPSMRVSKSSRSFQHCGLDYAGPVVIRASGGRGIATHKAYIALFICLATRAIHLELVGDCSTEAFLNAYSRFCARRGLPQAMYSDNATTFVGADREITAAYRAAIRDSNVLNRAAVDNVSWHFIPPSAPHFGGLWEAGVKSVKYHLRRVVNQHKLTFEEFNTLLCRIEACLNSRPMAPLSDTLDDYECLTPGHFLIGSAITAHPEPSVLDLNENRLSRWQIVRRMTERFWKLWQGDYINTLQQRQKWRKDGLPVKIGQLVLVRHLTLPPCKWELGRIIKCHAGSDDVTRVVTVKTATSEYKRPLVQLCVLPVECDAACHPLSLTQNESAVN